MFDSTKQHMPWQSRVLLEVLRENNFRCVCNTWTEHDYRFEKFQEKRKKNRWWLLWRRLRRRRRHDNPCLVVNSLLEEWSFRQPSNISESSESSEREKREEKIRFILGVSSRLWAHIMQLSHAGLVVVDFAAARDAQFLLEEHTTCEEYTTRTEREKEDERGSVVSLYFASRRFFLWRSLSVCIISRGTENILGWSHCRDDENRATTNSIEPRPLKKTSLTSCPLIVRIVFFRLRQQSCLSFNFLDAKIFFSSSAQVYWTAKSYKKRAEIRKRRFSVCSKEPPVEFCVSIEFSLTLTSHVCMLLLFLSFFSTLTSWFLTTITKRVRRKQRIRRRSTLKTWTVVDIRRIRRNICIFLLQRRLSYTIIIYCCSTWRVPVVLPHLIPCIIFINIWQHHHQTQSQRRRRRLLSTVSEKEYLIFSRRLQLLSSPFCSLLYSAWLLDSLHRRRLRQQRHQNNHNNILDSMTKTKKEASFCLLVKTSLDLDDCLGLVWSYRRIPSSRRDTIFIKEK